MRYVPLAQSPRLVHTTSERMPKVLSNGCHPSHPSEASDVAMLACLLLFQYNTHRLDCEHGSSARSVRRFRRTNRP